jgi:hypothetical protein
VFAIVSVCGVACAEGSRQLILCLVGPKALMIRYILTLLACASVASAADAPPQELLKTIRRFVPSATAVPPPSNPQHAFAGEFTRFPELTRRVGPSLNDSSVYLFTDGSYLFVRRGDVLPQTIYDRGAWKYDGHFIRLASDGTFPAEHAISGAILPLDVRIAGKRELCWLRLEAYQELSVDRAVDDLAFLIRARQRVKSLSPKQAKTLKARLLRDAWPPPGWFGGGPN